MARTPIPTWNFALVLVRLGRRFVLVHERKHGQLWYLPAGRVEPGESFLDAAVRETREESGIDVELEGIVRIEHESRPDYARMRVVFVARPVDDIPLRTEPNDDSLGAAWCTIEEMARVPLRSPEVVVLAQSVLDGAPVCPLSILVNM